MCEFEGAQNRAKAEARAWHEVATIWYRQHGDRTRNGLCAGCGDPIGGTEVIALPFGERVHSGLGDMAYGCLDLYGRRWKGAAAVALAAFGIPAPVLEEGSNA